MNFQRDLSKFITAVVCACRAHRAESDAAARCRGRDVILNYYAEPFYSSERYLQRQITPGQEPEKADVQKKKNV